MKNKDYIYLTAIAGPFICSIGYIVDTIINSMAFSFEDYLSYLGLFTLISPLFLLSLFAAYYKNIEKISKFKITWTEWEEANKTRFIIIRTIKLFIFGVILLIVVSKIFSYTRMGSLDPLAWALMLYMSTAAEFIRSFRVWDIYHQNKAKLSHLG